MREREQTYRTFIAIELPSDVRHRITEHIDRLRSEFPDVRASWTRTENLHLTLKFLGNIPVRRVPALCAATEAAPRTSQPFELVITGCGSFPPDGRPNVLWIGIETHAGSTGIPPASYFAGSAGISPASPEAQASSLDHLHRTLEDECARAGFARAARPYHPHLTIARLRNKGGSRALAERHKEIGFPSQSFTVSELVVFRSELLSEGSKHTAISQHELG